MERFFEDGMYLRQTGTGNAGRAGSPAGDTILYVHGLGESGLCFEALVEGFTAGEGPHGPCHLVPDLPGYGRSPWTDMPLTLVEQVDRLAAWLERRGEPPVVLVGHSMGGVFGVLFCERHPGLARALVNVEGNLSPDDCVFSAQAVAQQEEVFLSGGFDTIRDKIYRQGMDNAALRGYYTSLRLCDPRAYHLNSRELVEFSALETPAARLAALDLPRLYIAGIPRGVCPRSLELLDAAGLTPVSIESSGHWPFIDQLEAFASAFRRFLGTLP